LHAAAALPDAMVGVQYEARLVSGGSPGYAGHTIGRLPTGMHIDAMGELIGAPQTAGDFPFQLIARDSASPPNEVSLAFVLRVRDRP